MPEIRKAFHEELDDINARVAEMSGLATKAVTDGTAALVSADLQAAEAVIVGDRTMDELEWQVEQHCFEMLARQQPMAGDLRNLVTVMRVIHEMERAGDNMVNVAKAIRRMHPYTLDAEIVSLLERMGRQAVLQLETALQAFSTRDTAIGAALGDMDDTMDDLQKQLFAKVFAVYDQSAIQEAVQLALVGRYYERIADHAVNVGERVAFLVTGSMEDHSV